MLRIEESKISTVEKPKNVRQEAEQMKAIVNSNSSSLLLKVEMMKQLIRR